MSDLAVISVELGALLVVLYSVMLFLPGVAAGWAKRFPRNRPAAWILTGLSLTWAGRLLYDSPLGRFEAYRDVLFVLVPVSIVLVCVFVDELLAPRALGGLFILIPAVMLDAARWHASSWRFVVIVIAYIMVIKGCVLVVAPYVFRQRGEWLVQNPRRTRAAGLIGLAMGGALVGLGFAVY